MARPYEITPLSSNKTILQIVKGMAEYLSKNPCYKVIYYNGIYVSDNLVYSKSNLKQVSNNILEPNDVIVFKNSYLAVVDAVGDETFTIVDPIVLRGAKGDKGDKGDTGETGATGNGIVSVTKTGTSGLVDTYTILYTNGDTDTFDVTNGKDGQDGQDGATGNGIVSITKTGTSGLVDTYTILYTNGDTDTFTITNAPSTFTASDVNSETATNGQVLTANGSGGASWQNASSGITKTTLWTGLSTSVNYNALANSIDNYALLEITLNAWYQDYTIITYKGRVMSIARAYIAVPGEYNNILFEVFVNDNSRNITCNTYYRYNDNLTNINDAAGNISIKSIVGLK